MTTALTPAQITEHIVAQYIASKTKFNTASLPKTNHSSPPTPVTRFDARTIPTISVPTYITRMLKYAPCEVDVLIMVIIHLNRFDITVNLWNIHRILITSFMVAAKYSSDTFFTNTHYAKVGGLPTLELNKLEIEFLSALDFNVGTTPFELSAAYDLLARFLHGNPNLFPYHTCPLYQQEYTRLKQMAALYSSQITARMGNGAASTPASPFKSGPNSAIGTPLGPPTPPASPEQSHLVPSMSNPSAPATYYAPHFPAINEASSHYYRVDPNPSKSIAAMLRAGTSSNGQPHENSSIHCSENSSPVRGKSTNVVRRPLGPANGSTGSSPYAKHMIPCVAMDAQPGSWAVASQVRKLAKQNNYGTASPATSALMRNMTSYNSCRQEHHSSSPAWFGSALLHVHNSPAPVAASPSRFHSM